MSIIRTHRGGWEAVPRIAAENQRLGLEARAVLFWLLTRPQDWEIRVGPMLKQTGCSQYIWLKKVKPQLIKTGYLTCKRVKLEGGRIGWEFDVYTDP